MPSFGTLVKECKSLDIPLPPALQPSSTDLGVAAEHRDAVPADDEVWAAGFNCECQLEGLPMGWSCLPGSASNAHASAT